MLIYLLPNRLRRKLAEHATFAKVLNLLAFFLAACAVFCVSFKYTEKVDWEEALWQVWQTVTTVGYGNKPAATTAGRICTMLFGLAGIAVLGALISSWFDWRTETREQKRYGQMENPFENGYIVINFPGAARFAALATELAVVEPHVEICVVCSQIEELPLSVLHLPKVRVHFVKGSLLSESTYKQAGIQKAKGVMVFPQQTGVSETDATTKMVVDIVSRLVPPTTRIIHVLVDPANEWLFEGSSSTPIYELDEILVMVQECQDMRSAALLQNLLLNTRGANPKTVTPHRIIGWKWSQFTRACLDVSERDNIPINPLGLFKGAISEPCPAPNTLIEAGDSLSLIVNNDFNWERFEEALMQVGARS
jgi:voltage-gated potassium channel